MCVIMYVDKVRPTEEMVEKAFQRNDDGGGVAWREGQGKERVVRWMKGLELDKMQELIATLPMPFVAHFRVASCGGVRAQLCHPFPVEKNAPLALEGSTKGYVLFHNGDWKDWARECREASIRSNTPIPLGKWSDTRAMAWLCAIYGPGFMEFLSDQKGVLFGPRDAELFTGSNGWKKVFIGAEADGQYVWCSNDYFTFYKGSYSNTNHGYIIGRTEFCKFGNCNQSEHLDASGHCPRHRGGQIQRDAVTHGTGGSQPQAIPFPKLSQGQIISLELAEKLHKQKPGGKRLVSKGLIQKIRKAYANMTSQNIELAAKGTRQMEHHTATVIRNNPNLVG